MGEIVKSKLNFPFNINYTLFSENARIQENATGADLSDQQHNPAQLCPLDGHTPHLLLRVRGVVVGHRPAGCQVHRVLGQVPREVQGSVERRLPAE